MARLQSVTLLLVAVATVCEAYAGKEDVSTRIDRNADTFHLVVVRDVSDTDTYSTMFYDCMDGVSSMRVRFLEMTNFESSTKTFIRFVPDENAVINTAVSWTTFNSAKSPLACADEAANSPAVNMWTFRNTFFGSQCRLTTDSYDISAGETCTNYYADAVFVST